MWACVSVLVCTAACVYVCDSAVHAKWGYAPFIVLLLMHEEGGVCVCVCVCVSVWVQFIFTVMWSAVAAVEVSLCGYNPVNPI